MAASNTALVPALSVVIPSVNGWPDLDRCLMALDRERTRTSLEAIVPVRESHETVEQTRARFPWARVISVPAETTIPQMRAIAFREARAATVAVIEDHVIVSPGWADAMVAARTNETRVVGGGLVNAATRNTVDWAAWLCEYNHLAEPMRVGEVDGIHGNHTAYDRDLLIEFRDVIELGRWEDVLHEAIREKGVRLWARPDILAGHQKHYSIAEYTSQRFLYSRAYAAMRLKGAGFTKRLIYGGAAFLLPPILLQRIVSRVWRGGLYRKHLPPALPLLALFTVSWALGEVAGAWFGDGGALAKVR